MPKVKFVNEKITVDAAEGEDIRTIARKNGVQVYWGPHKILNCWGMGSCCSCSVVLAKGKENVSKKGILEGIWRWVRPLFGLKFQSNPEQEIRLACQTKVSGDVEVVTHPSINWHGEKFWS
ncbi:MAG: 2Fe-2S iron-sulfur cluster-binding protein [Planctomycetota bacterium]|nr:2Fe-2S iron-sulfur cluster-binding protein [Planctomycetota bacterium]